MLLDAYRCKKLVYPLEDAHLYLQKAKHIVRGFEAVDYDDAQYKAEMLGEILKFELDYNLPSFKESLSELQGCIKELFNVPSEVIVPYIRAQILLSSER